MKYNNIIVSLLAAVALVACESEIDRNHRLARESQQREAEAVRLEQVRIETERKAQEERAQRDAQEKKSEGQELILDFFKNLEAKNHFVLEF